MTPERRQASRAGSGVQQAILSGRLVVQPCAVCGLEPLIENGRQRIQGHHYPGYARKHRLDVQWLCRRHHQEAHGRFPRKKPKRSNKRAHKTYAVYIPKSLMEALRAVSLDRVMTGPGPVAEYVLAHFQGSYADEAWKNFGLLRSYSNEEWVTLNLRVDQGILDEISSAADEIRLKRGRIVPAILLGCRDRFDELAVKRPEAKP